MNYNTETVNAQFINLSFVEKLDQGLEKEAGIAMSAFVRQKLREDGFTRRVFTPITITAAELDRQVTEEPQIIVEKEPDSIAAVLPFLAQGKIRYWTTPRYPVIFEKLTSAQFEKNKFELMTYRTDIRTVLQENSVKDLQEQEDGGFITSSRNLIGTGAGGTGTGTGNAKDYSAAGGFTYSNLLDGVNQVLGGRVPVGCILMTQQMYNRLLTFPASATAGVTVITPAASEFGASLYAGKNTLEAFYGYKLITTNKADLIGTNECFIYGSPDYLGQFYILQDAVVFLEARADMIKFYVYESVGLGLGNVNSVWNLSFNGQSNANRGFIPRP